MYVYKYSHLHGIWKSLLVQVRGAYKIEQGSQSHFSDEEDEGKKRQVLPVMIHGNNAVGTRTPLLACS